MSASERGDEEIVTSLITARIDVNITDSVRYTQYLLFCVSLHMSATQDGDSALIRAARKGKAKVVSLLLKAGANTDLQNKVRLP